MPLGSIAAEKICQYTQHGIASFEEPTTAEAGLCPPPSQLVSHPSVRCPGVQQPGRD